MRSKNSTKRDWKSRPNALVASANMPQLFLAATFWVESILLQIFITSRFVVFRFLQMLDQPVSIWPESFFFTDCRNINPKMATSAYLSSVSHPGSLRSCPTGLFGFVEFGGGDGTDLFDICAWRLPILNILFFIWQTCCALRSVPDGCRKSSGPDALAGGRC